MEKSALNRSKGFTLIEVLIAVAILAIGLLAVVRVTSVAINNSEYLKQKMLAHWVAMNVIANADAGLTMLPSPGAQQAGQEQMLGQTFSWKISASNVAELPMMQLKVGVSFKNQPIDTVYAYVNKPGIV